ncbi:MAG: putative Fe-S cluster assembly protein SufT [Terracidiphilus sp.]
MLPTNPIELERDCEVIEIPSGARSRLTAGTRVRVIQLLGSSYTISDSRGILFRIDASDADALGLSAQATEDTPHTEAFQEKMIWDQLKKIFDPEIPVNIVDLGLIYEARATPLESGGKRVEIKMSMTAPGCGMANVLKADVETRLARLPEVREVQVDVVFDPPWQPGMMSDAAKLELGFDSDFGSPSADSSAFKIIH